MKVETLDRLEAIGAARWSELHKAARLASPFLTFEWQQEWVRAFAPDRRLEVRTVSDATGRLLAVLPLYEAADGVRRAIGGTDVSDYLDLLAVAGHEEDAWSALLAAHRSDLVLELHAVPADSPTVSALPALAAVAGLQATLREEERCPVLSLPASWDAYLSTLSGKHRHELQRKIRRLAREAPDARVTALSDPADIDARFADFLELHRRSRTGKARFMDETMEMFFRRGIAALARRGEARLTLLDSAAGPMAAFITLEWPGTVGLYNSGFHPERAALSPGLVLLARLVEDAIARGKERFDFLRGEERYKYEFGPTPRPVYAVRIAAR